MVEKITKARKIENNVMAALAIVLWITTIASWIKKGSITIGWLLVIIVVSYLVLRNHIPNFLTKQKTYK